MRGIANLDAIPARTMRVPARLLRVHPTAQRDIVKSALEELKAKFDLDLIGVLYCVEYEIDGVWAIWIVDGQHRWKALLDLDLGDWDVDIKIYECNNKTRASQLFLGANDRATVRPIFKFKNEVDANDPVAVGVVELVGARGFTFANSSAKDKICCFASLKRIYEQDGGRSLAATLDTVIGAFGRVPAAVEGKLLEGIGLIYGKYKGAVDRAAMIRKLAKYRGGASGVLGDAKVFALGRSGAFTRAVAETVIAAYNNGRQTGRLASV